MKNNYNYIERKNHYPKGSNTNRSGLLNCSLLISICYLLFVSCNNPFNPSAQLSDSDIPVPSTHGTVQIQFDTGKALSQQRTVLPPAIFNNYVYTFTKLGGPAQVIQPEESGVFILETGDWTVKVDAYIGGISSANLAATGEAEFAVVFGPTVRITVPLTGIESTGYGILSYDISYPLGATVEQFYLTRLPDGQVTDMYFSQGGNSVSGTQNYIPSGFYLLNIQLSNDNGIAGICEVVHIYANMTTEYEKTFNANNFNPIITVTNTSQWDDALNQIRTGGNNRDYNISVLGDVGVPGVYDNSFGYVENISVTINGNGKLYLTSQGSILRVGYNQNLYIDDLVLEGLSAGQNGAGYDNDTAVVYLSGDSARLDLRDGSISGNTNNSGNGGGVFVGSNGTFTMQGSALVHGNTSSSYGGGVYVSYGGTFRISGGTIYGNAAGYTSGGASLYRESSATAQFGVFSGSGFTSNGDLDSIDANIVVRDGLLIIPDDFTVTNTSQWNDALTLIRSGGNNRDYTITVTGEIGVPGTTNNSLGNVSNITVTINGDGRLYLNGYGSIVRLGDNQTLYIEDIVLEGLSYNNTAAVYVDGSNANLELRNGSIRNNTNNSGSGGGVYINNGSFIMQDGALVNGNLANSYGGGVYVGSNGTLTMQETAAVYGNNSYYDGGGIYVSSGTVSMQDNVSVYNNTSYYSSGGGVFVGSSGTFTMQDSALIYGNTASSGGGVYVDNNAAFTMQDSAEVYDNTANSNGGGVFVGSSGTFTMQDSAEVYDNTANSNGGGVFVTSNGTFTMSGGTMSGNTASYGGGVYLDNNSSFTKTGGTIFGYPDSGSNTAIQSGHAIYASTYYNWDYITRFRQTTVGSGADGNLSFLANATPPVLEGIWYDWVTVTLSLEDTELWDQSDDYVYDVELSGVSNGYEVIDRKTIEVVLAAGYNYNITIVTSLDGEFYARGWTANNAYIYLESDNVINIRMYRLGAVDVGITFTGLHDEVINLTSNTANDVYWGQTLEVTVDGSYDSYRWYLNGDNQWYSDNTINITIGGHYIGIHNLMVIVTRNGIPYSKELIFRVAYKEGN